MIITCCTNQVLKQTFLCQNVPIFSLLHIPYNKVRYILVWSYQDILELKISNEKSAIFTKAFWIIPTFHKWFSMLNCANFSIAHTNFMLWKLLTTWLTSFIPYLACTTCTNPVLRMTWSYRKLLNCVKTANSIC